MSARGWVLFAAMSVIWGIPYLLIKIALEELPVPVLILARTLIGAAVLLPVAWSRANLRNLLAHWKPVLAFAFFEVIAAWLLLTNAERHLSSSTTGLLIAASPIIATVLDRATGSTHRLDALRWAGLIIGLAGVAVLAGPGLTGGGAWPVVQVLLVATCYAIAPLIAARYLADVPALPMTAGCLVFAALVYTVPAALQWPTGAPGARVLVATVLLAVVCTALAFVVFFALIREVGPTRAVVFTYVNPAVALVAGVLILAEPLTVFNVVGLALILVGSVLATHDSSTA
ncbi:MAG: DMT family transporter [Mycobacterium sp.]